MLLYFSLFVDVISPIQLRADICNFTLHETVFWLNFISCVQNGDTALTFAKVHCKYDVARLVKVQFAKPVADIKYVCFYCAFMHVKVRVLWCDITVSTFSRRHVLSDVVMV